MKGFCLEVCGPFACFTRPEMKVERVSYDVITPSAARAIFEAILWKPAISWRIRRIEILAPIRWASVRRNEVASVASLGKKAIFIEDDRQQRAGLLLRDVKYRLFAEFDYISPKNLKVSEIKKPGNSSGGGDSCAGKADESEAKYASMFERRARNGQCFNQPYLGCREFAAQFRLVDPEAEPAAPIAETRDMGWMLYDLDFTDPEKPKPLFFKAKIDNGVIRIPDRSNPEEVRG